MSVNEKEKKVIRFISINLFVLFFAIYLLTAAENNLYHTDASVMQFQVSQSIVEGSDLSIPEGLRGIDRKYYSWMGIGSALLSVPFYIVGKLIGVPVFAVSIVNQLFGAITIVFIFLFAISLGYSKRASLLVAVFYGLGTIAWPLAKQPFDHPIEAFFTLLSVYFMYLYSIEKKVSFVLCSAASLGVAFITRSYSILFMPALFILMVVSLQGQSSLKTTVRLLARNVVLFSITLLPFLVLFLWYNQYRFGSIVETGYSLRAERLGIDFFNGAPFLTGLSGLLISPGKGFFYYSPVAILFFFSIKSFMKKHLVLCISFILIILSYLLFLSKNIYWHGDWAWGPRYLLVITPFFIIPTAELFDSNTWKRGRFLKVAVSAIFIVSFLIQFAAVSVDFQKYFSSLRFEEKVKFTEARGYGVLPVIQPPTEIYFNFRRSPILKQFHFIYEIARGIKDYKYMELPDDTTRAEEIMRNQYINNYDFWWLYNYFLDGSYSGIYIALMLLFIAIFAAVRLWKIAFRD